MNLKDITIEQIAEDEFRRIWEFWHQGEVYKQDPSSLFGMITTHCQFTSYQDILKSFVMLENAERVEYYWWNRRRRVPKSQLDTQHKTQIVGRVRRIMPKRTSLTLVFKRKYGHEHPVYAAIKTANYDGKIILYALTATPAFREWYDLDAFGTPDAKIRALWMPSSKRVYDVSLSRIEA